MRRSVIFLFILTAVPGWVLAQSVTKGRELVQEAAEFQNKLADSSVTLDQVIQKWSETAAQPDVKKDPDAEAIAFGSGAVLEIQKGNSKAADSLFKRSLPLFRLRESKAPILVAYAEWTRANGHNMAAIRAYDEIVHTMDSIPELWNIEYYRLSGYAPYAYAIDACFGLEQIAASDPIEKMDALKLLKNTLERHPNDALGMMAVVALHRLGEMKNDNYKFNVDLMCSRKPELRGVNDLFERKFKETESSGAK